MRKAGIRYGDRTMIPYVTGVLLAARAEALVNAVRHGDATKV